MVVGACLPVAPVLQREPVELNAGDVRDLLEQVTLARPGMRT